MNFQKNMRLLEEKIKENPNSLLFAHLADCFIKENRFDEAINLCLKGLKVYPGYITANFILGKAYLAKGDLEKAESELKKVLTYDREYLSAHKLLADLMARHGWENKAVLHYKDILQTDPLEEEIRHILDRLSPEETSPRGAIQIESILGAEESDKETQGWIKELDTIFSEEPATPKSRPPEKSLDIQDFNPVIEDVRVQKPAESEIKSSTEDVLDIGFDLPELDIGAVPQIEEPPVQPEPDLTSETIEEEKSTETSVPLEISPEIDQKEIPGKETEEGEFYTFGQNNTTDSLLPEDFPVIPIPEQKPTVDDHLVSEIKNTISELKSSEKPVPADEEPSKEPDELEEKKEIEESTIKAPEGPHEEEPGKKVLSPTLGEIYIAQGQFKKALSVFESLLEKNPKEKRYSKKIQEINKKIRESGL